MKLSLYLVLLLSLARPAYAAVAPSAEVAAVGKTLDFVADVSKYQAMFDSVVEFCRPHAPEPVLKQSLEMWRTANQRFLDLRDSELNRVIEDARANGTESERVAFIEDWAKQQYTLTLSNNRMYKDLLGLKDLPIACSRRLGEMNHSGMSLHSLSPRAAEYARTVGEP
ncbi:hypothetical protein BH24GEM2_BH24GEM2_07800 [soil metagenome]